MKKRGLMIGMTLTLLVLLLLPAGCIPVDGTVVGEVVEFRLAGQQEGIAVEGRGEVTVVPDIAVVNLGVQAQALTVAEAQAQATSAMENVMAALREHSVEERDIQTTGFTIWQQTRWEPTRQEEQVIGYRVSNNVQVKIRQVDEAGIVLDAAVAAGGDHIRVQGIYFQVDEPSEHLEEARSIAVQDARAKAGQLAQLAGVELGNPTYISETSSSPVIFRRVETVSPDAMPAPATPIEPGETTITATVEIIYAID